MKRAMMRKQYDKFCESWKNEKIFQRLMTENGEELPEGTFPLGKKPTFSMWMTAIENQKNVPDQTDDKKVEVNSTDWEE